MCEIGVMSEGVRMLRNMYSRVYTSVNECVKKSG